MAEAILFDELVGDAREIRSPAEGDEAQVMAPEQPRM
jgi:hypothetical protein